MSKTDPENLTYPAYAANSRPALALEAFKALLAEQPDWCKLNYLDREKLTSRVKDALTKAKIPVGRDKAAKIANRVLNDIHHATRKASRYPNVEAMKSTQTPQSNAA